MSHDWHSSGVGWGGGRGSTSQRNDGRKTCRQLQQRGQEDVLGPKPPQTLLPSLQELERSILGHGYSGLNGTNGLDCMVDHVIMENTVDHRDFEALYEICNCVKESV